MMMADAYYKKCHSLMNELSKKNKQIMKLQVENVQLKELLMDYGELDEEEIEKELKRS